MYKKEGRVWEIGFGFVLIAIGQLIGLLILTINSNWWTTSLLFSFGFGWMGGSVIVTRILKIILL